MNSVLDFIQSLQEMKKSQVKWAGLALSEKASALQKISTTLDDHSQPLAQSLSRQQNLPVEFVLANEVLPAVKEFSRLSSVTPPTTAFVKPTGLISILLPEFFSLRILSERLAPALLAGNGVFLLTHPNNPVAGEFFKSHLDPSWPIRIFNGGEELAEIMAAHPGIQAVSFYGLPERAEKILKTVSGSWKKWQITSGYHNAALVLNDADLASTARQLVDSCFLGMGQLHWNISTIYVTEALLPDFQKHFVEALQQTTFAPMKPETLERMRKLSQQLVADKAKILFGGGEGQPLVVEDLSHCSVLQQDCLNAPVVLISPVKYVHEMVKWTNTSYFGMSAQIFGSDEKVERFARQLDVSRVSANAWIESMKSLPFGMKQSFSGLPSLEPFGDFFSDCGKIDGLETKS